MKIFKTKLKRVGLLMTASALLLLLFVVRWLQSEYNNERNELQKDLFEQFVSARSRMTDTLIAKYFIEPMLKDSSGFKIRGIDEQVWEGRDSLKIITGDIEFDTVKLSEKHIIGDPPRSGKIEMRIETDSTDMITQGVKLFINRVHGPAGEGDFFEKLITPGDTVLIKSFYAENLETNQLFVTPVWISGKEFEKIPPPMFYYETHFFDHPYGVQVEKINVYLFRKLTPQILFALLLLAVIITAFIFSYRSLRGQMRLAALKDDLVSNISHELKTPVATVKVALEAMQEMDPVEKSDKIKSYIGMATQEINRLDMLVNKVMNSILLDNGKQVFQNEPIKLASLVEETIAGMSAQVHQKNAAINFHNNLFIDEVQGDPFHLKGVLFNLIDNSLKYGGDQPEINITLENTMDEVILTCSDNGPGIPEAYIHKVFEKFFRVPTGNEHANKGYGLGLYYALQVVTAAGGSIEVKNNEGRGCTFTLRFPTTA